MAKYIMALDQGTTSSRCILFDKAGNICSMAQKEFEQIYPRPNTAMSSPFTAIGVRNEVRSQFGRRQEQ